MNEYITLSLLALAILYIVGVVAWLMLERRRTEKKQREIINSLKVGQVWHSAELEPDDPFGLPFTLYSRITDIRRNHRGDVWVVYCYRDQPEVLSALPATSFIEIYPFYSNHEQTRISQQP